MSRTPVHHRIYGSSSVNTMAAGLVSARDKRQLNDWIPIAIGGAGEETG